MYETQMHPCSCIHTPHPKHTIPHTLHHTHYTTHTTPHTLHHTHHTTPAPEIIYRGIGNGINQHELTRAILERTIKGTNPYYSTTDEIIKLTKEFS